MTAHWTAVVTLLRLAEGSSRLGADAASVTRAIGLDTLAAVAATPNIAAVVALIDEQTMHTEASTLSDKIVAIAASDVSDGDTVAIDQALRLATGSDPARIVVVRGVLPALDPDQLGDLLTGANAVNHAVVSAAAARGTTVLVTDDATAVQMSSDGTFAFSDARLAQESEAGPSLRQSVTSARELAQARSWPHLGARTRAIVQAQYLEQPRNASNRRYGIDPPPSTRNQG